MATKIICKKFDGRLMRRRVRAIYHALHTESHGVWGVWGEKERKKTDRCVQFIKRNDRIMITFWMLPFTRPLFSCDHLCSTT